MALTVSPIRDANEATVKATGIPRLELIGTAFSECFTEPEKAKAVYQLVFEKGMAVDYPLTMRHRDGTLTEARQAQRETAEQQVHALERLEELERFQRLTVGRELKMIELKKEIESLRNFGPADGSDLGDLG